MNLQVLTNILKDYRLLRTTQQLSPKNIMKYLDLIFDNSYYSCTIYINIIKQKCFQKSYLLKKVATSNQRHKSINSSKTLSYSNSSNNR